jgi:glycosyltransferase involved in cell wall biosynthesis
MKYNFVTKTEPKTVTVITPTIGSPKLQDAMLSVSKQNYKHVKHLIVVDGPKFWDDAVKNSVIHIDESRVQISVAPENTGANGFYGHRIYAAYPHLMNTDYIFFLDEDNWYEPDHVESLVDVLNQGVDFAYSLRKIYDENIKYVCDDNCESLGKWPIWFTHDQSQQHHLIDTSSFAFRREFLIRVCHFWHHGWGGDRHFFYSVKNHSKWETSGKHTLCYRLDGNPNSAKANFFVEGNERQSKRYEGKFPWLK